MQAFFLQTLACFAVFTIGIWCDIIEKQTENTCSLFGLFVQKTGKKVKICDFAKFIKTQILHAGIFTDKEAVIQMYLKKIFMTVLALCLVVGCVGCGDSGDDIKETETSDSVVEEDNTLTVASDGYSDYVIVYDGDQDAAKTLAHEIVTLVYSVSGALIKLQDVSEMNTLNEHEIIVGDARECVADVVSQAATEDFAVVAVEDDIVLWASDSNMYTRLLRYLKNYLIVANPDRTIALEKDMSLFYGRGDIDMSFLTLFEGKKTDYVIVYDSSNDELDEYVDTFIKTLYSKCGVLIRSKDAAKYKTEHEIVVGEVRDGVGQLVTDKALRTEDDFMICVDGDDIVLYATDNRAYAYLFEYFANDVLSESSGEYFVLASGEDFVYSTSKYNGMSYVEYYQSIYKTYSSQVDEWIENSFKAEDKNDVALVRALVERLGEGFAVYKGSSSALYDGHIVKLDKSDYSKVTLSNGDVVKIPAEFAREYFGQNISVDANGYFDLTEYCKNNDYSLYTDSETGISVIMPASGTAFGQSSKIGGYTDEQYIARMKTFFVNPYSSEPSNNTEQSRVVIEQNDACYNTENTVDYTKADYSIYYDPTILSVTDKNGKTVLYSAYSETPYINGGAQTAILMFEKSEDGGATWKRIAKISGYNVPAMFEDSGYIYIMGGFSNVQVTQYNMTTGALRSVKFATTDINPGGGGPGTVLIHDGRVYKSYANVILSAPLGSNYMVASSWTVSTTVSELYNNSTWRRETGFVEKLNANPGYDWEEGSVLLGKDGKLYVMYRSNRQIGTMLIYELSKDGKTLSYVTECNGTKLEKKSLIYTPSSISRPAVHYDESTGLYISLMCLYMGDSTTNYFFTDYLQRAVLGFVV